MDLMNGFRLLRLHAVATEMDIHRSHTTEESKPVNMFLEK